MKLKAERPVSRLAELFREEMLRVSTEAVVVEKRGKIPEVFLKCT